MCVSVDADLCTNCCDDIAITAVQSSGSLAYFVDQSCTDGTRPSYNMSRFWVEKGGRKHRKNVPCFLAESYGPGLKTRLR